MFKIDRRLLAHFEWPTLLLMLLIIACGLATILSATYTPERALSPHVIRQGMWCLIGLALMIVMMSFDYRRIDRYGYVAYGAMLLLLALVPIIGISGGGSRRWIGVGSATIQPSEFMKIGLVLALARHLHRQVGEPRLALKALIAPAILFALPAALILKQPDLGTVIALGMGGFSVVLMAGLPMRLIVLAAAIAVPVAPYAWEHLKPYQKQRIVSFADPDADPLGSGYHVIQSKIAIGSGGFSGKGYLHGTQNQLNFIPEQHTDFIFSVFSEEWGFMGGLTLLGLYIALIARCAVIASRARDNLGALLVAGLTATIFWQAFINIAMTTGSLPVVGITLPFLSYGGSSMLTLIASVGLIMNVGMRRYTF
jgi:rod shape determining protein RodA